MTTKSPLEKIVKGILYTEEANKQNHKRTVNIKFQENNRQVLRK
jgi:hypothetical protein